ncbi:hypothetical protein BX666DRAFT_1947674 [Dichotomocladium elegans]|nr:hypothetical protein BX666DRAFT_1947674 [Dichotomocladium elegans]
MGSRLFWLSFIRFLGLFFSAATLACHIVQIVLLRTNGWFPSYIPYILYFVGPGVSLISSIALNIVSMTRVKSIRGDRILCMPNVAIMIAVIVYNTLKAGAVPWTKTPVEGVPSSATSTFVTYCKNIDDSVTANRCWLTDGMWLGCLLIAACWILLGIFVFLHKGSDIYEDDFDVYDFKDDVPMVMPSPTPAKDADYHAASPATTTTPVDDRNFYSPALTGGNNYNNNKAGYNQYDSYYDYPPQAPYAGYQVQSGGYAGSGGYQGSDPAHIYSPTKMHTPNAY